MEVDAPTQNGTQEEPGRRKSGRIVKKPDLYNQEEHVGSVVGATKRKRVSRVPVSRANAGEVSEGNDEEDEDGDDDEEEEEEESDGEPDEEEVREQRRARRKRTSARPATKRARTANGASATLAIRSAKIPSSKPLSRAAKVQKARSRPSQINKQGLYAEVFGRNQSAETVANSWISTVKKDSVAAMRDLINFVFECIGYEASISTSDIEDIDNVPNRLGEILEDYAKTKDADYPLVSKARQYAEFRTVLTDFFFAIIKALHHSADLHEHPEIYENIHVWVGTMSGANYRPFRHTATVISLTMTSALCEVAAEIQQSMATAKTQLDSEKKKKTTNKARVRTIEENVKADERKLEAVDGHLRDAFDTVYVHRYRDVAEIIRADCVAALGKWILTYRKMFLEGQYLRYLGWVMSDPSVSTRHEVLRQLKAMFKNQRNIPALRAFTDRFRSRMVEMGARDADVGVRVEAIELLDHLRGAELLEPTDIETVGLLIFDAEARVRKAVAKFFVANIEDMYAAEIEGLDEELYAEALPKKVDDFTSPQQCWIKFKCLATALTSSTATDSDSENDENTRRFRPPHESETRYMLATQAIFPHMAELAEWESLAGYLLYDHSSITAASAAQSDDADVQGMYKLAAGEEIVLLDVLYFSARIFLSSVAESVKERKGRGTKATKAEIEKKQEKAAQNLSTLIPQLLSRYGSTPQATASILRLEQLLDADLINETQGEGAYEELLEDIHKQFVTHSDQKVLAEATKALRTARSYEQSKEATDAKVLELWHEARDTLFNVLKGKNVETRGTLDRSMVAEVLDRVVRVSNLASVSDCTEVLEAQVRGKKQKQTVQHESLLRLLLDLVKRGVPDEETALDIAESEDQIASAAITTISFYFRWKVVQLKNVIEKQNADGLEVSTVTELAEQKEAFVEAVLPIIASRPALEPLRITATLNLLDLFILLATTKNLRPSKGELDEEIRSSIATLSTQQLPDELLKEVMTTHDRMERLLAKKTNRRINLGHGKNKTTTSNKANAKERKRGEETQEEIEAPPQDSDDEAEADQNGEDDDDDDDDAGLISDDGGKKSGKRKKREAALLAEQALCELASKLVLACFGGVVDGKKREDVKARLQINRTKLGKSYAAVVAYLDEKDKEKDKKKQQQNKNAAGSATTVVPAKKQNAEKVQEQGPERMEVDREEEDNGEEHKEEEEEEEEAEQDENEAEQEEEQEEPAQNSEQQEEADDEIMGD